MERDLLERRINEDVTVDVATAVVAAAEMMTTLMMAKTRITNDIQ